jgi:hypothetical protein
MYSSSEQGRISIGSRTETATAGVMLCLVVAMRC